MKKGKIYLLPIVGGGFLLLSLLLGLSYWLRGQRMPPLPLPADRAMQQAGYGELPLSFEPNEGQVGEPIHFLARGQGYTLALLPGEAALMLQKPATSTADTAAVVRMQFTGADRQAPATGLEPLPGKVNYYLGNDPQHWRTGIATFAKVQYRNIYPGIDLIYYGNQGELEYDFVVAPGADPRAIALNFAGLERIEIDAEGAMLLHTADGAIKQHPPRLWQQTDDGERAIAGRYVQTGASQIGFEIGEYDTSKTLVIDPVLVYSTFFGGTRTEYSLDVAVDAQGQAHIVGNTTSADLPVLNAAQSTYNGRLIGSTQTPNVFVAKLNATGTDRLYATYLGGQGSNYGSDGIYGDYGRGIAVDKSGNTLVTGETWSNNFSMTGLGRYGGGGHSDAFITSLSQSGTLNWSRLFGGYLPDGGFDVAADQAGNVYFTGYTSNDDDEFGIGSLYLWSCKGNLSRPNAFVAKVEPNGVFYGHSCLCDGTSYAHAISVDQATPANIYVAGITDSYGLYTTPTAFQRQLKGGADAFVIKLPGTLDLPIFATYLGGSDDEDSNFVAYGQREREISLAVDGENNVYVGGLTKSADFPMPINPDGKWQSTYLGGWSDGYLAKLNASGSALLYSTYIGGSSKDAVRGVAVDTSGNAWVTGDTESTNFFTRDPLQATNAGYQDTFVMRFSLPQAAPGFSSYLGASGQESSGGVAVDAAGDAYLTGTTGAGFPTTPGAFSTTAPGGGDAFVTKLSFGQGKQLSVDPEALSFSGTVGQSNPAAKTFTLKNISNSAVTWQATATTTAGGNWLSVNPASGSLNAGQSITVSAAVDISNVWADLYSGTVAFSTTSSSSSTPLNVTLTVGCPLEGSLVGEADAPNCNDVLNIGIFEPPVGEYTVDELKTKLFKANVTYLLQSKKEAELVLRIFDQNGNRLGSSNILSVKRPVPPPGLTTNVDLQIAGSSLFYDLKPCLLNMYALLIDSSGNVIKRSNEISYVVKGENCGDSIEMRNPLFDGEPAATAKIYTGSEVEYKCDIRYHIPSDPKGGVVALQAFDMTSGAATAISNIVLVPVDKTTEPKLLTGEKITVNIPSDAKLIQMRAVLLDSSGVTIVTKHFVDYVPIQIKIELGEYNTSSKTFTPFNPPLVLRGGGDASKQRQSSVAIKVTPSLDVEFNQAFPHFVVYKQKGGEIIGQFTASAFTPEEPLPNPIYRVDWADFFSFVPDDADQLLLQLKYNFVTTKKVVSSNLVPLEIDRVKIITKSGVPNFPSSATILKQGRTEKFGFWLEYNMKRPGVNELQAEVVCTTPSGPNTQIIKPALKPSGQRFEFDVTIPSDAQDMHLSFRLANQSDPAFVYSTQSVHCKNMDKIAITIPSGVGQVISNTLGVSLNTVQNAVDRAVDAVRTIGNLGALAGSKPKSFALEETSELAEQNATIAAVFSNYLLVNSYWSFTPAIPADGTFVADLTLQYNTTDLPDDPAFDPASLKVIAYDPATGTVEAYPSNVNLSARTVTARINRLAPYYTLGVENPLTARALDFPVLRQFANFDSRLLLLNTGSATAALTMRAYATDGTLYSGQGMTNPASVSLPASQLTATTTDNLFKMTNGANGGWMQAAANQRTVLGYEMIGKDNRLDGLSVQIVHPGSFVISQAERNATWETEIHLANASAFIGTVALELRDSNGAIVGTWEQVMRARSAYSAPLSELFPTVPASFNGYVLGQSDQPVSVAALLTSNAEIAALNAQPWQAENTPATLYLPFVSYEPGYFASKLNLVNPTASTATLQLRLRDEQGQEIAPPVNLTLQPGQQYQRGVHQIFSVNGGFAGAVTIECNVTGIVGDVEYNDPSGETQFRTVMPLLQTPTNAYVFPHIDTRVDTLTQLAVFNPNAQPVQVEVKVFKPDGTANGSTKFSLPGNAFFSEWIDELILTSFNMNGGYFTVTTELPICAGAVFGTLEGTMMAALPGQPLAATTTGSVASVSAASYATAEIAVDSIISAFGSNLATNTQLALVLPLPTTLLGTSVSVKDSVGTTRLAPLFFVSPLQINYQVPSGTSTGMATITVTSGNGIVSRGTVSIVDVAPGLFTADQNGAGLAAANALYVKSSGYTYAPTWRYDPAVQKNVAVPIEVTREGEEVFLELYGTGISRRANLSDVQCQIGGVPVEVLYAGMQGGFVGLDQVNVRVPPSLAGRGEVDIVLTVAGRKANTTRVHIR